MLTVSLLAYVTGSVKQELLLRYEYLAAEPGSSRFGRVATAPFTHRSGTKLK
jgi:hypothetical protein